MLTLDQQFESPEERQEMADMMLKAIQRMAEEIEEDDELAKIDERYRYCAKWIDADISNVSL